MLLMSVPRSEQHALQDHLSVYPLDTCAVAIVTHSVILVLLVVTKRCHPMHHHTPREQFWQELALPHQHCLGTLLCFVTYRLR